MRLRFVCRTFSYVLSYPGSRVRKHMNYFFRGGGGVRKNNKSLFDLSKILKFHLIQLHLLKNEFINLLQTFINRPGQF